MLPVYTAVKLDLKKNSTSDDSLCSSDSPTLFQHWDSAVGFPQGPLGGIHGTKGDPWELTLWLVSKNQLVSFIGILWG